MSSFIRDSDLLGTLAWLVPECDGSFAAPRDFPQVSDDRAAALKPPFLVRPYLSSLQEYAATRTRILIEALRVLRDRHNETASI